MSVKSAKKFGVGETRTRRQKVEDREQAIIAAASDMFNSGGYAKTTMADIAAKSGVADGTIYLYFKNKEALAYAVLAKFYDELTLTAQEGVDALSTHQDRIRFLAVHHLTQVIAHWRLLEMLPLINESMENYGGSEIYEMNKAYVAVFDRVAKDAATAGYIRGDVLPWVLRDNFYGSMDYGARTIVIKGRRKADIDVFVDNLMRLIFIPIDAPPNPDPESDMLSRLERAAVRIEQAAAKLT
jgi:AcrR family transcriptional regulator